MQNNYNFKKLDSYLESMPERYKINGGDLAVHFGGKEIYRHQFGYAFLEENRKMQGNEFYRLYSCTKVSTCVAVMQLIDSGKITLETKLSDILPEYKDMYVFKKNDKGERVKVKAEKPIRIIDLMQMTGGFDYNCNHEEILKVREKTNGRCPNMEISKAVSKMVLGNEPGTCFVYSLCHDVLAFVVEKVSGEKFSEYMKKNIFLPLGMTETGYKVTKEMLPRYARLYRYERDKNESTLVDPDYNWFELGTEYESGGAGVVSTVNDYIKIADMLTRYGKTEDGKTVISEKAVDLMRKTFLPESMLYDFGPYKYGYSYGLGVRTHAYDCDDTPTGKYEFGWDGAAGAYIQADIEKGVSVYFGCATQNLDLQYQIQYELKKIIYECIFENE